MDSSGSMVFKVDHFVSPVRRKKRIYYTKDLKELILKICRANLDLLERDKRFFHAKVAAQLEENGYDIGRQALSRKLREILDEPAPKADSEYSQQFVSDLQVVRDAIVKAKKPSVKDERLLFKGDTVFDKPIVMHPVTQPQVPQTPVPGGEHTMSVSPHGAAAMDPSSSGTNLNDPRRPSTGSRKAKDKRLQYKGHVIHLDEFRSEEPAMSGGMQSGMQPQAGSSGGQGGQGGHGRSQSISQGQGGQGMTQSHGQVHSQGQGGQGMTQSHGQVHSQGQSGQGMTQSHGQSISQGQGHSQSISQGQNIPGTPVAPTHQGSPLQGSLQGSPLQYGSRPGSSRPSPNTNTPTQDFSALLSDDMDTELQADLAQELNPIGLGLSNVQSVQGLIDAVGQVSQGSLNHDLLKRLVSETERLRSTMEQSLAWEKERAQQAHDQRRQLIELQKERVELVRRLAG